MELEEGRVLPRRKKVNDEKKRICQSIRKPTRLGLDSTVCPCHSDGVFGR